VKGELSQAGYLNWERELWLFTLGKMNQLLKHKVIPLINCRLYEHSTKILLGSVYPVVDKSLHEIRTTDQKGGGDFLTSRVPTPEAQAG
jgi:hypothetical protein